MLSKNGGDSDPGNLTIGIGNTVIKHKRISLNRECRTSQILLHLEHVIKIEFHCNRVDTVSGGTNLSYNLNHRVLYG